MRLRHDLHVQLEPILAALHVTAGEVAESLLVHRDAIQTVREHPDWVAYIA